MPTVELMRRSARVEVLPRRCVITGSTQDVTFRRVWVPARSGWAVRMDLPFAEMAYRRWNASWLLLYLSVFLAIGSFLAGILIAAFGNVVGAVIFLAGVLLPIASWVLMIRGNGPEVLHHRRDAVVLYVPSEEAAREMQPKVDLFEYREVFTRGAAARRPAPAATARAPLEVQVRMISTQGSKPSNAGDSQTSDSNVT